MDLDSLTDEELEIVAKTGRLPGKDPIPKPQGQNMDLESMSDQELEALAFGETEAPSSMDGVKGFAEQAFEVLDTTAAPGRKAHQAYLNTGSLGDAAKTYANEFGNYDGKAPTGKSLVMQQFGASDNPNHSLTITGDMILNTLRTAQMPQVAGMILSANPEFSKVKMTPADYMGFAWEIGLDPLNLIPLYGGVKTAAASVPAMGRAMLRTKGALKSAGKEVLKAPVKVPFTVAKNTPIAGKPIGLVGDATTGVAKELKNYFNPNYAPDLDEYIEIGKKIGIAEEEMPGAMKWGKDSIISHHERRKMEGVTGEPMRVKLHEMQEMTRAKLMGRANEMSGVKSTLSPGEAGAVIREGVPKGVDDFFKGLTMNHNRFLKAYPDAVISGEAAKKLAGKIQYLYKRAQKKKGSMNNAVKKRAENVEKSLDRLMKSDFSYETALETMKDIREDIFEVGYQASKKLDVDSYRDVYFALNEALLGTVKEYAGEGVEKALRKQNELTHHFLLKKSRIQKVIGHSDANKAKFSDEKIFQKLVTNGDSRTISELKEILPQREFLALKSAFLKQTFKSNIDDVFTFGKSFNRVRDKREVFNVLFEADEAKEIIDYLKFGDRLGYDKLSFSGTGGSNQFSNIIKNFLESSANDSVIDNIKIQSKQRHLKKLYLEGKIKDLPELKTSGLARVIELSPMIGRSVFLGNMNNDGRLTGQGKWQTKGFGKLYEHADGGVLEDPEAVEYFLENKKAKSLFREASGLKPGSKRMDTIYKKLEEMVKDGSTSN